MPTRCMKVVRGTRLRVTRVDSCGRVVYGDCSQVVTAGFVTANLTMETEEGSEISITNAAGDVCIADKKPDYLNYIAAEIEFCEVDPDLFAMINPNYLPITDANGNTVGFQLSTSVPDRGGFALEIWSNLVGADVCDDPDAEGAWGYMLLPYLTGGLLGDLEFTNDAITFTINANTRSGNQWGSGPYGVVADVDGTPSPLWEPLDTDAPGAFLATTIAPPEPQCGCQPVTEFPTEPLAVTAVADPANPAAVILTITNARCTTASINWGDGTPATVVPIMGGHTAEARHTYAVTA